MVVVAAVAFGAERVALPPALKDAAPNTWVTVGPSKSGSRVSPLLFWSPEIGRVVCAGGALRGGRKYPGHHTEEFDLADCEWRPAPAKNGGSDGLLIGSGYQYNMRAYVAPDQKYYVRSRRGKRFARELYAYDAASRTWEEIKAPKPEIDGRWGALGYDPVHNELMLCGGHQSEGRPTWLFGLEGKTWRRLIPSDEAMVALHDTTHDLYWQATELTGRAANRFTLAETAEEAKEDLGSRAMKLSAELKALGDKVKSARVQANHAAATRYAQKLIDDLVAEYAGLKTRLGDRITPELLGAVRAAKRAVLRVRYTLSPEPTPRAFSPLVLDPAGKCLVLFGGDRLDSTLSDTWVYDCKTRSWSQRFPETVPPPRGGHVLGWLPEAGKVVLAGGYARARPLAQDIWTYDLDTNEWKLLKRVPVSKDRKSRRVRSPDCPGPALGQPLAGAVCPGDVLVAQTPDWKVSKLYACRVDATVTDTAGTAEFGVAPGTIAFHNREPAQWEKVAAPDADKTRGFLAGLKPNVWTEFKSPLPAPGGRGRWGTVAYDPERKQFLYWGGGHATTSEDEVSHFSLRGGCWTISYPPDHPQDFTGYMSWFGRGFTRRPAMPWSHAYQAYEYSPGGKMCLLASIYDVRAREWLPENAPGLKANGVMRSMVEYTPHGAVCISEHGLYKFDAAENRWSALPWNGPKFGPAWCDGHALCYDSKRDCLWAANAGIYRYDFKTGKVEKLPVKPPSMFKHGKKTYALFREQAYIAHADLILIMRPLPGPDGKLSQAAWDPETGKYYWVDLPHSDGKTHNRSWSSAIAYDPDLKLALMCDAGKKVWVLKFDRTTAKLTEIQ